ncbi:LysR family transcriptional regulator [Epibacterium sp. SM1979]|uniref:LysR family transcriptional regulator n=1 Tax=Tritonibacter litoralis TaxID=2662264 RepID=A0A843YMM4_9RHOB|nr:LysR family transcriptional regulator [Tritonibacter litoralis]MQQ10443.1 LysR family transcriptional regulator [Tritonibacter litoralis]
MMKIDVSQINGQTLRVFLAVFDEVSVSQAALSLGVSQSSVSHTLEKLRGTLGVELFQKSGRGIVPTAAATRIAPQMRKIMADLEALGEAEVYQPNQDPRPIVIAMNGGAMAVAARAIQKAFWREVPMKQVTIRELGARDNLEESMYRMDLDVAIVPRLNSYPTTVRTSALYVDQSSVFYDADVREPIQSVPDYGAAHHIVLDFGGRTKSTVEQRLEEFAIQRKVTVGVPNVWLLAEVMEGTSMVATLPDKLHKGVLSRFAKCPVPFVVPDISFDLVWHLRHENSARQRWIRDVIKGCFKC